MHGHESSAFLGKAGCHHASRAQGVAIHGHHVVDAGSGAQATQEDHGISVGRDFVNQPSRGAAGAELFDQGRAHARTVIGHHQIASGHQTGRGQAQGRSSNCT